MKALVLTVGILMMTACGREVLETQSSENLPAEETGSDLVLGDFLLAANKTQKTSVLLSLCEKGGKWSVTEQLNRSAPISASCVYISCLKGSAISHPIAKAPAPSNPIEYGAPRSAEESVSNSTATAPVSSTGISAGKLDPNSHGIIAGDENRMGQVSEDTVFEATPQSQDVVGGAVESNGTKPFSDQELLDLQPIERPSFALNALTSPAVRQTGWKCQVTNGGGSTSDIPMGKPGASTPGTR